MIPQLIAILRAQIDNHPRALETTYAVAAAARRARRRGSAYLALVFAPLAISTFAGPALADGMAFPGCGNGGPQPFCYGKCPRLIDGDCSNGYVGEKCGEGQIGECWEGEPECRPADAGATPDGGRPTLFCQVWDNLCPDEGGCNIGKDDIRTNQRKIGLPAGFIVSGLALLALDRRRRTRRSR